VLKLGTDHLVIGRMGRFHVREELYENGRIDVATLQPLGRLGGTYTKVETIFELPSTTNFLELFLRTSTR
jgi:flavin reductase (DIM6/NTAB) family NADH-FMN oxidoreductase RutF